MGSSDSVPVQATATSMAIVEALSTRETAGVTELAEELGISKSAVHIHLSTLSDLGYVAGTGGAYRLTHRFLQLGLATRERNPVFRFGRAELRNLARSTGEIVNLVVPEGYNGVYLYRIGEGEHPIPEGGTAELHASAAGKAILAFRSHDAVDEYVEETSLPARTDRTITDPSALRAELRSISDRRIAFDRGEQTPDWQCVASPIVVGGQPVGAISVSGPADRMQGKRLEEDTTGLVVSTAKSIELSLLSAAEPVEEFA